MVYVCNGKDVCMMQDVDQFVESAVRAESIRLRIPISEFEALYRALRVKLRDSGIPPAKVTDIVWLNLKAWCPACGCLVNGSELGKAYMFSKDSQMINSSQISIIGPGRLLRFAVEGVCFNEKCSSSDILLRWHLTYELLQEHKNIDQIILMLTGEQYWFARKKAAEALGQMSGTKAVEALITALNDENKDVVCMAVISLGQIGYDLALGPLRKLLAHEENIAVREVAEEAVKKMEKALPINSHQPVIYPDRLNGTADWSTIRLCHECGAGNPCNAVECIRCKKPLPQASKPTPTRHLTSAEIARILYKVGYQFPKSRKPSFGLKLWRWLYRWLLKPFCIICLVLIIILLSVAGIVLIVKNVHIIAGIIVFGLVFFLLIMGVNYLIETQDLREAKRDEKYAERAKRVRRKKQTQLNIDVERITSAIKKQLDSQELLENILPNIRTKNYEAISKAVSSMDSLKDTEKGCLFNNMDPDFISHALTYFKDSEKITILQQIEPRKREDVLLRFSLPKRSQLKLRLKL